MSPVMMPKLSPRWGPVVERTRLPARRSRSQPVALARSVGRARQTVARARIVAGKETWPGRKRPLATLKPRPQARSARRRGTPGRCLVVLLEYLPRLNY